jgi:hypothetical protein
VLAAGIHPSTSRHATLREVVDPRVETRSFDELSRRRQAEIVAARIRAQKRFRLWVFGTAPVTKRRAIDAVLSRTPLGEALIAVERRILASLAEETARRRRRGRRRRPA